jgi:hypothetical protein
VAGVFVNVLVLSPQTLNYFITVGAMIGGVLAIVFSLKTLIMQHAAENSSAGFYRTLGKDKRQDIVFFLLVFSVLLFVLFALTASPYEFVFYGIRFELLTIIFQVSIFIIGFDLYLIFLLHEMLFKRIDPFNAIKHIQRTSFDYLDSISQRATQFADLMMIHPKTDKKTSRDQMLASTFQSFKPDLQFLSYRLEYLFDYHDKVLSRNDKTASLAILDVIASILEKYFVIRKDSSFLLPSGFFFVSSSDSQEFLTPHLERLVSVGQDYLKQENAVGVRKVISIFQELAGYAGEIKFIGSRSTDNPILMQCRGYLDQFMESVIQKTFFEGMFKGASAYTSIGAYVIRKNMMHEMMPIYDMLDKIAYAALLKKQEVVVTEVVNGYAGLIHVLAEDYWLFQQKIELILEHTQQIIIWAFIVYKGQSIRENRMQQDVVKPYESLADTIYEIVKKVPTLRNRKKTNAKGAAIEGMEELRASLRQLSENLNSADRLLIHSLANIIEKVGMLAITLINDPEWSDEKRKLTNLAGWYIHQPKWFTHDVAKIESNLNFDALPEATAKMGIVAVKENQMGVAEESVEIISQFAIEMLEKEAGRRYGFTEPRIMVLGCYVGILALKQGQNNVINKLKELIPAFEEAYKQKWFSTPPPAGVRFSSPSENQLMVEVLLLIDTIEDLNRVRDPFGSAEEMIIREVSVEDVKKFIKEIWGGLAGTWDFAHYGLELKNK